MENHPLQPVYRDEHGVIRFRANKIVRMLLDVGPLDLKMMDFSDEDRAQFAQLIGYSVSGFGDLSYVNDETVELAKAAAEKLLSATTPQPRPAV